jgi:hypothetical protein
MQRSCADENSPDSAELTQGALYLDTLTFCRKKNPANFGVKLAKIQEMKISNF